MAGGLNISKMTDRTKKWAIYYEKLSHSEQSDPSSETPWAQNISEPWDAVLMVKKHLKQEEEICILGGESGGYI